MYFHTDDVDDVRDLAEALARAARQGKAVRIDVDSAGRLKYKIGGGMWTPSIDSTHDINRDAAVPTRCEWVHREDNSFCGPSSLDERFATGPEEDFDCHHGRPIYLAPVK
ncbi:MAG: hypothetical protein JWP57_4578 [Spirosoma sp.]|nr:hypothetical protein [Spirosoma sp.]